MSDHLGELLSAHLDGELDADESARVHAHLSECDMCRDELAATSAVRLALRAAPAIDPPFGFLERVGRRRRNRWVAGSGVAVAAAAWVAILGFAVSPGRPEVKPPVDDLRVALASPDVGGFADPIASTQPLIQGLHRTDPNATPLPSSVTRLPRTSAFTTKDGQGTVVVFGAVPTRIVVFIQRGTVEWTSLRGGLRSPVDGLPGKPWRSIEPKTTPAVVVQAGDTTVVVVGDAPMDQLEEIAREVGNPEPPSVLDRLRDAAWSVVEAF